MNKSIFKTAVAVAVTTAAVFCIGCSEKPDEDEGENSGGNVVYGTPITYEGETYQTVVIGTQTWMAENLNYDVPGVATDVCYDNNESNCAKYGRLYDWATAKTVCPSGWHLPSDAEWTTLTNFVGGASTAGKKLKSTSGWYNNGNGTDDFGFSALPGGNDFNDGFNDAGYRGRWWSATERDADDAWSRIMHYNYESADRGYDRKAHQFSVRCVQD